MSDFVLFFLCNCVVLESSYEQLNTNNTDKHTCLYHSKLFLLYFYLFKGGREVHVSHMILWESEKNLWKTMWVLGIKLMETWKQAPLHMEPLSGIEYIIFICRLTPSFLTFQHSHRPKLFCITFSNVLACTCILYILFQMTSYPSIMSLGSLYV